MNAGACNSKQKQNHGKCRCECKELDDWSFCANIYMWDPSACDCKCNNACKIYKYLDIKNCLCEKGLFSKLVIAYESEILNTT